MTYEQSLKNIEVLKNYILPFGCDYIYFNFINHSDFEVIFLDENELNKIEDFIIAKFRAKQPFTHIRVKPDGQEVLYYEDAIIRYEYSLTTHEILKNDYKNFKKRSVSQLKLDMAKLLFKLKNISSWP